jgi:hypothetical protein
MAKRLPSELSHPYDRLTMAGGQSATNRALPTSARRRSLTMKVVEGCVCLSSVYLSRGRSAASNPGHSEWPPSAL